MDRVTRRVLKNILKKHKVSLRDIFKKHMLSSYEDNIIEARDHFAYILYIDYNYSIPKIASILKMKYHNVYKRLNKYALDNKLTLIPKFKHNEFVHKHAELLMAAHGIPYRHAATVISHVYRVAYTQGYRRGRNFDRNSFSTPTLVPSDENNAPVTLLEAPGGLLKEVE